MQGTLKRIERAEKAAKAQSIFSPACICFPEKEQPFFVLDIEQEIAGRVKCPLHGERFKPRFHIFVAGWLREIAVDASLRLVPEGLVGRISTGPLAGYGGMHG
jgi:hypothetical protein